MRDSLGRDINYLRISLTDRCNMRCIYCMPPEGIASKLTHDDILRNDEIVHIVRVAAGLGFSHIRLTGGEPLIRKNVTGIVKDIAHIPGIDNIALTTNGVLLPALAQDLRAAGLNRINLSLDTLDEETFRFITRTGSLQDTLAGLDAALAAGFDPIKVNAVAIRQLNQDFYAFARMSVEAPLHVRFIEYMPVGASSGVKGCGWGAEEVISCEEILDSINTAARAAGVPELAPVGDADKPLGYGPARYYRFPGARGSVGFISPLSNHFCGKCNRIRLTADGKLRPCLFSDIEYDVRAAVRTGTDADIEQIFCMVIDNKPDGHNGKRGTERRMSQIGG